MRQATELHQHTNETISGAAAQIRMIERADVSRSKNSRTPFGNTEQARRGRINAAKARRESKERHR